jgi:hypothetical protein
MMRGPREAETYLLRVTLPSARGIRAARKPRDRVNHRTVASHYRPSNALERVLKSFWSDVPTGPVPVERVIVDYRRRLALLLPPPSARTNGAPLVRAEGGGSKTRQNRLVVVSLSFHRHRAGGDVKKAILKHALKNFQCSDERADPYCARAGFQTRAQRISQ